MRKFLLKGFYYAEKTHHKSDEEHMIGRLLTDRDTNKFYEVVNGQPLYYRKNNKVFEEVAVIQKRFLKKTECTFPRNCSIETNVRSAIRVPMKRTLSRKDKQQNEKIKYRHPIWRLLPRVQCVASVRLLGDSAY
ncbi:hypothetical protein SDC9_185987 [bioreactor metagenome]|uniref:Uncharacterized protein n=1 Tax=bioreactor metagenome TaxID=1076179 RepID=A0A645HSU8_9ZZZZ|nr:hypothetical protein [Lawsonibacter sp.]